MYDWEAQYYIKNIIKLRSRRIAYQLMEALTIIYFLKILEEKN